jgi:ABC-type phosphate/phosphonate transport system substrate-binding protein
MTDQHLACLPMYDPPELHRANDALWHAIAARLPLSGVPDELTRSDDLRALWRHPGLLLGQTCGYPLMTELGDAVQVVATPVYRAPGCDGAYHRSAIVVRTADRVTDLAGVEGRRCVINGWDSNSGMNLLRAALAPIAAGRRFFTEIAVSGSHRESLRQVAAGAADVAAIDCVTLALLRRIEPETTAAIRVLAWTPASPSLPLITAAGTTPADLTALRAALADVAADPALSALRDDLLIDSFVILPADAYGAVLDLEAGAARQGYPRLATVRPEGIVHGLVEAPRARGRKGLLRQAGLGIGIASGILISGDQRLRNLRSKAGIVGQMPRQGTALVLNRDFPGWPAIGGLVAPFQKMGEEDDKAADKLTLLAPAHALDLLGNMLDVGGGQFAGAKQGGLLVGPGVEIALVEAGIGHGPSLVRS